jgi:hypothetical protein
MARAISMTAITSESIAWTIIDIFAQVRMGSVSAKVKAVEVEARYR